MRKLPIGYSDFKRIREDNFYYVDKTLFIKEVLDTSSLIQLIPRPRRFGKTLNMSTLYYYFNREGAEENRKLFEGLKIMKAREEYSAMMGRFPVIFLSFKDAKNRKKQECFDTIKGLIQEEYLKHSYLRNSGDLSKEEKQYFERITGLTASSAEFQRALKHLLIFLNRYHGEKVIILIDEYDAPIHGGYNEGYYDDIIIFMRNFLSGGLKDTSRYLQKSVLTGILRVAQESIFSGLNNPGVFTLLDREFSNFFGFTEDEVEQLLEDYGLEAKYEEVKRWYNGYVFGKTTIYNPWSIINFAVNKERGFKPYWLNTSDNKLIEKLLIREGRELKEELTCLLEGNSLLKPVNENIIFPDLNRRENLLWSFLLFGGYLKQEGFREINQKRSYFLSIPNNEVRQTYTDIIDSYFCDKIENKNIDLMLKSLLAGNLEDFEELFSELVINTLSHWDVPEGAEEKVYHAFTAGLLVWLSDDYRVKSNRESGLGRYDIMLIPKDINNTGFVIEFKRVRKKETLETAIEKALAQIEEKQYEAELRELGVKKIRKLAMAFKGKEVVIKEG